MSEQSDPVAAECARQERAEKEVLGDPRKGLSDYSILLEQHCRKRGKLIAALMANMSVQCHCGSNAALEASEAAIAEFASGEGA